MDSLARPDALHDFDVSLMRFVAAEGSIGIVAPLQKFLEDSHDAPSLRASVKNIRPALIADISHFLCISHGRHPGVVDHAASKIIDDIARDWLVEAINGFVVERAFLNQLTVAAGPITRQNGQEKITAILEQQSKSFQMLATSDRKGTAAGAAIAFVIDWQSTRPLLDIVAISLGIEPAKSILPPASSTQELAGQLAFDTGKSRAMMFGAQQLLSQQRGLWQLIAARHAEISNQY
jgi:hypothetical protein